MIDWIKRDNEVKARRALGPSADSGKNLDLKLYCAECKKYHGKKASVMMRWGNPHSLLCECGGTIRAFDQNGNQYRIIQSLTSVGANIEYIPVRFFPKYNKRDPVTGIPY